MVMRALGLMSGTSMDGIDLALVDTDGDRDLVLGATGFAPYDDVERECLKRGVAAAAELTHRGARPPTLAEAERLVTDLHVRAVARFMDTNGLDPSRIDVCGFHGQTMLHRPERGLTIQIGDAEALARRTGLDIVADFRAADVAAGGQGAPLVPVFHQVLARVARLALPAVVLNLGGVANITYLPPGDADPLACDTGPGNALVDDLMLERTGVAVDREGATAATGRVDAAILSSMMAHPFFAAPPPKSLDRNAWSREPVAHLSTADAAATLTAFTAESVAVAVRQLPCPTVVVVCGGGARNHSLMRELGDRLPCPVRDAAAFGWDGEAIEAQAFAYLAVRSRVGLPLTFPTTTGVRVALPGGVHHAARRADDAGHARPPGP